MLSVHFCVSQLMLRVSFWQAGGLNSAAKLRHASSVGPSHAFLTPRLQHKKPFLPGLTHIMYAMLYVRVSSSLSQLDVSYAKGTAHPDGTDAMSWHCFMRFQAFQPLPAESRAGLAGQQRPSLLTLCPALLCHSGQAIGPSLLDAAAWRLLSAKLL